MAKFMLLDIFATWPIAATAVIGVWLDVVKHSKDASMYFLLGQLGVAGWLAMTKLLGI